LGRPEDIVASEQLDAEDQIVVAIRRIMHAFELHSRQLVDRAGMTLPQLAVLRKTAELGRTPIGSLARAVHLSQPTVSGILDRLERRGLLQRVRDEHDRRAVNINITASGEELLSRAPSQLQDAFREQLQELQEWELTQMLSVLQRVAAMMETGRTSGSRRPASGLLDAEAGTPPTDDAALSGNLFGGTEQPGESQ
jgi:DNA-binding MarR family transcriptional regulator